LGITSKHWRLLPHDRTAIEQLAATLRVPPIVAQVLLNRGLGDVPAARLFLDAPLAGLHRPELLPDATAAAERLYQAVQQGRRICVFGDYDVDGISGTAILWQALKLLNAQADFYVPHRLDEGYGLNSKALQQIAQSGATLVITVDCGITAVEEAEEAKRLGLELIVTDHHEPKQQLPAAAVLVHPSLPGGTYPFAELSGAGVAFKVAWALCMRACGSEKVTPQFREFLLEAVALATLGLVADVVALQGENRVLVGHGLKQLQQTKGVGLRALLESAGIGGKPVVLAEDIAFKLAPRLNAAGRLGPARLVVELLTTNIQPRATDLVRQLEGHNQQRQQLERRIASQAREQISERSWEEAPALVLASEDWHPGVIGIVAGRLAEQYARPALLIALTRGRGVLTEPPADSAGVPLAGHGSGRAVPGFPLHEALQECSDLLLSHGGHAAAAGFRIEPERIDEFRDRFCLLTARRFPTGMPPPQLVIDAEVPLSALTLGLMRDLDRLEPFGSANRRPLFLAGGLEVVGEPQKLGGGERHLGFRVRQGGTTLRCIAFGMGDRLDELLSDGGNCCLVFAPKINEWQGRRNVELEVVDLQAGPQARLR